MDTDHDEIEVPEYFICPISLQTMKDPVTTVTGITYDRESIEKWLLTADPSCPVTKQPLTRGSLSDLTPNHMLRRLIQSWCTANALDRIPTPKTPLHRSLILKLVRNLDNNKNMEILEQLAAESEKNRKLMADSGVSKAILFFLIRCYNKSEGRFRTHLLGRALRVLQLTWTPSDDNKQVLEDGNTSNNYLDIFVPSFLSILRMSDDEEEENGHTTMKSLALVNLKNFTEIVSPAHLERLDSSFFEGIVKALRRVRSRSSGLQILVETAGHGGNRRKMVEAGAVEEVIEMELGGPGEKRTTELIFGVLAQACGCAEGRQRVVGHAAGVAVAAKRLLRVSAAADDRIVCVMEWVVRYAATRGVVVEMLRVGGVSKLCMVLQAECAPYLKKKAREILRLRSAEWADSPCIQLYLLTRYE